MDTTLLIGVLLFHFVLQTSGQFSETLAVPEDSQDSSEIPGILEAAPNKCCFSSGIPMAPRVILLGQTGAGKSTLANRLLGNMPGKCASKNSLLDLTRPEFGVGHDMVSHTNETTWITGHWLGNASNPCVTFIDTPGIGDSKGRDCEHAQQIAQVVREMGDIHGFLLLLKGADNRFTPFLREQLNLYEEMFGTKFWLNVAIDVSFWSHDKSSIKRRKKSKMDEHKKSSDWNHLMQEHFDVTKRIPVLFVDPIHDKYDASDNETQIFERESSKLWEVLSTKKPFQCDIKGCKNSEFTEGIPSLVTETPIRSRPEGKLALTWQIWFGDCGNTTGIRSYQIMFRNTLGKSISIFTMTDNQQKGEKIHTAKDPSQHNGFPSNAFVEDKCSKMMKGNVCDNTNSKFKMVTLIFQMINANDFGNYTLVNAVGHSKEVEVRKVTDGTWGEWSKYGPCSKKCLSKIENVWGNKFRTRHCTKPQNGGNKCAGIAKDTIQCAHGPGEPDPRMCEGVYGEWSSWSQCDKTCGGGVMRRRRKCGEITCKADEKGRTDDDEKACNSDPCPVPSEYGEWSRWGCREICYNPNEKHLTREVRTRECIKKYPRHELGNCDRMMHLQEVSQSPCTHITICPELRHIEVLVCRQEYSGTDDNAKIRFRNGVDGECSTLWLDSSSNDFQRGTNQVWKENFLSSCSKRFRPTEGLQVLIELDTYGINCHSDELQVCKVKAHFGNGTEDGSSVWRWSKGTMKGKWNRQFYGCFRSYISKDQKETKITGYSDEFLNTLEWLVMCKACSTAEKKNNRFCCE